MTKYVLTLLLLCQFGVAQAAPDNRRAIVTHYTNLAHAVFDDAETTAQTLLSRVEALLAEEQAGRKLAVSSVSDS